MSKNKPNFTAAPSVERDRTVALRHLDQGLVGNAAEMGERLIENHPNRFDGYVVLAKVAKETSDFPVGLRMAIKAIERCPAKETELYRLAVMHATLSGDNAAAEYWLNEMSQHADKLTNIHQNPGIVEELHARYLERNSRFDEALSMIQESRRKGSNPCICNTIEGRCLHGLGRIGEAVDILNVAKDIDGPLDDRCMAYFILAKIYDKEGEFDNAWQAAQDGHALLNASYDPSKLDEVVKQDTEGFTDANLKMWQRPSDPGAGAIMICAMARSGTSLLEQILSMHPKVHPAGESGGTLTLHRRMQTMLDSYHKYPTCFIDMTQPEADKLQRFYFDIVRPDDPSITHTTDKSLGMFHRLGLVSVLMPGASVICLRRHPLDNLLSCHMTQLALAGHVYASNLEHLAHFWKTKERVTAWSKERFDLHWLDLSYEQLTHDQEGWTRKLVDHCGLEWDDACLNFHRSKRRVATISHDQVTQKMYTSSVERWRNYEKHLQPLIKALGSDLDAYDSGI